MKFYQFQIDELSSIVGFLLYTKTRKTTSTHSLFNMNYGPSFFISCWFSFRLSDFTTTSPMDTFSLSFASSFSNYCCMYHIQFENKCYLKHKSPVFIGCWKCTCFKQNNININREGGCFTFCLFIERNVCLTIGNQFL